MCVTQNRRWSSSKESGVTLTQSLTLKDVFIRAELRPKTQTCMSSWLDIVVCVFCSSTPTLDRFHQQVAQTCLFLPAEWVNIKLFSWGLSLYFRAKQSLNCFSPVNSGQFFLQPPLSRCEQPKARRTAVWWVGSGPTCPAPSRRSRQPFRCARSPGASTASLKVRQMSRKPPGSVYFPRFGSENHLLDHRGSSLLIMGWFSKEENKEP